MSERQELILKLIELRKTIDDIRKVSNLSDREIIRVVNTLKGKGYNIENYFDYDSSGYSISHGESHITKIKNDNNKFSCLLISDTHLLSQYESIDMIDKAYDFASKTGINYILHMGDFIHGDKFDLKKLEQLLKDYPKDKNMTTLLVMGNHDGLSMHKFGINISNIISSNRCDIVPLHDSFKKININDAVIEMCHKSSKDYKDFIVDSNTNIILKGHKHIFEVDSFINSDRKTGVMITVPSLSKMVMKDKGDVLQNGMVQLDLNFNNNKLRDCVIEQYGVDEKILKLGEINYQFRKIK